MQQEQSACDKTCELQEGGDYKHSINCLWEHFMCYTNYWGYPEEIRDALKHAYEHGYEAGEG